MPRLATVRFAELILAKALVGGSLLLAQLAPAEPAKVDPSLATVEGRVTTTVGTPIEGARVALVRLSTLQTGYQATTNEFGVFRVVNIPAGTYRVAATHEGFFTLLAASTSDDRSEGSIEISSGEHRTELLLKLIAKSVITGRITDKEGRPVHAEILLVQKQYKDGRLEMKSEYAVAQVDADGRYTITDLNPGRYYIRVRPPASMSSASLNQVPDASADANREPDPVYVDTYYPGAANLSSAIPIEIERGRDAQGIDIQLAKARLFSIRGKVVDAPGSSTKLPAPTGEAVLLSLDPGGRDRSAVPLVEGRFEFLDVGSGNYKIQVYPVSTMKDVPSEGTFVGEQLVSLTGKDPQDIVISRQSGSVITGQLSTEGTRTGKDVQAEQFSQFERISLTPIGSSVLSLREGLASDRSFRFPFVPPGDYRLSLVLETLPYFKSVRFGGQDITGKLVHVEAGQNSTLEVLHSFHVAQISGVVRDINQRALPGIAVSAWAEGAVPDGSMDIFSSTTTNLDGEFRFRNLPPGTYSVLAWEHVDAGLDSVRDFRRTFMGKETTLDVKEDGTASISLYVIPRSKSEAEAAKSR